MQKKKGISLIVLVITIIVMIILAATIIISLNNNGIVEKANESVFKTNAKNYQQELSLYLGEKLMENPKYNTESLNADNATTPNIADVITSMKEEDKEKFRIVAGTLFYIGDNKEEETYCEIVGVKTQNSEFTEAEYNEIYKEEIALALENGNYFQLYDSYFYVPKINSDLDKLVLPYKTTHLSGDLDNWTSLKSIVIPCNCTRLENDIGSFSGTCYYLEDIVVMKGNPLYDSRDNCNAIIETATNTLICGAKNTVIPNSVTEIGQSAFIHRQSLVNIKIPNNISRIWGGAFSGSSIESIVIPSNINKIEFTTFYECSKLKNVYIESTELEVEAVAFSGLAEGSTIYVRNLEVANALEGYYDTEKTTVSTDYNWVAPAN